ncbi:hypothetical protein J6590_062171 [Homalodisca vitripennis]|nr:hypothetical protein J6590_062171 [Homalodisca vitripennis]
MRLPYVQSPPTTQRNGQALSALHHSSNSSAWQGFVGPAGTAPGESGSVRPSPLSRTSSARQGL